MRVKLSLKTRKILFSKLDRLYEILFIKKIPTSMSQMK